ncbi:Uma2 family endonuclease [Ornithinimicrobium sp. F0845]|uniref:Uma2 family endonuclease n=1 Tax=Ornithinimicrobium sp. F0845 TaxID=2926412 RepID=UPI001FF50384|nr:Uma2 family endonuclease [Ornithinimicrobium sp. F0845]MCK0111303.1 Uma2 family endonuclease [Ornithinimicrobium sp. F0845]
MPTMPRSRALTLEDFEAIREVDDGHRYELIDGSLVVTPSPVPRHQTAVGELAFLLRRTIPRGLRVFVAPLDIRFGKDTVLQPDVLVVPSTAVGERRIEGGPVLAVEVLSPSTRHIDLGLKLSRYEAASTPAYWVIDPDEPSLRAWELREGRYEQTAHVVGDQIARLNLPWAVEIVPSHLVDDLR